MEIGLAGPSGFFVDVHASLFDEHGEQLFRSEVFSHAPLPLGASEWRSGFKRFLEKNNIEWQYLEASYGQLDIDAGDLGGQQLRFEHDVPPLRLMVKDQNGAMKVRLIDDSGLYDEAGTAAAYSMEKPDKCKAIHWEQLIDGTHVPTPGALYVAERANYRDSVVVSGGVHCDGLKGLGVKPYLDRHQLSKLSLLQQFQSYCVWRKSRAIGPLAQVRQEQVSNKLLEQIHLQVCGSAWMNAERLYVKQNASESARARLENLVDRQPGFAIVLSRDFEPIVKDHEPVGNWFVSVATAFKLTDDDALASFALTLSFDAGGLCEESPETLAKHFALIQRTPTLLRGARLLKLLYESNGYQSRMLLEEPSWQYVS